MTTEEKITIPMSERRPLRLVKSEWPTIARADWHDGQVECQANHVRTIRVRAHADGRRVVYGWLRAGNGGTPIGWRGAEGGYLVQAVAGQPDDEGTIRAIRRVGGIIDDDKMADECIGDLPPEEVDAPKPDIRVPRDGADRLLALLDRVNECLRADPTAWTVSGSDREDMLAAAAELRDAIGG